MVHLREVTSARSTGESQTMVLGRLVSCSRSAEDAGEACELRGESSGSTRGEGQATGVEREGGSALAGEEQGGEGRHLCSWSRDPGPLCSRRRPSEWGRWRMALGVLVALLGVQVGVMGANPGGGGDVEVWSHQLIEGNFSQSLSKAQEPWALVEFFASWCPACMHFKPHYERVARIFNDPSSPHADFIYVAKVDCAVEGELCQRFAIQHYPTMLWAKPHEIAHGRRTDGQDGSLEELQCDRNADGLLAWINKRTDKTFSLVAKQQQGQAQQIALQTQQGSEGHTAQEGPVEEVPDPQAAVLADMEEATAVALNHVFRALRLEESTHAPLLSFVDVLATYHPSSRCRAGSLHLHTALQEAWGVARGLGGRRGRVGAAANTSALVPLAKVCGPELPSKSWVQCKGSLKDRRGYSCGLWLLFHALSLSVPDADPLAGKKVLSAVHDFVANFFICGPCRAHFVAMAKQTNMRHITQKKDAVLWLWRAHNIVNARLAKDEAGGGGHGDPSHPKHLWPSVHQCPRCRMDSAQDPPAEEGEAAAGKVKWNEDAVLHFLEAFYAHPADHLIAADNALALAAREADSEVAAGVGGESAGKGGLAGGGGSSTWLFWLGLLSLILASCCVYALVRGPFLQRSHHLLPSASRRRKQRPGQPAAQEPVRHGMTNVM